MSRTSLTAKRSRRREPDAWPPSTRSAGSRISNSGGSPLRGDGSAHVAQNLLEILPHVALRFRRAKEVRRMERRHHGDAPLIEPPLSAKSRDAAADAEQALHGSRSERDDHVGVHELDLLGQVWTARSHFIRLGLSILRRPALHDVADVYVVAAEPHRPDHAIETLPRLADEGVALRIFIRPRPFADEAEPARSRAARKHRLRSCFVEPAFRARRDLVRKDGEASRRLLRRTERRRRSGTRSSVRARIDRPDAAWRGVVERRRSRRAHAGYFAAARRTLSFVLRLRARSCEPGRPGRRAALRVHAQRRNELEKLRARVVVHGSSDYHCARARSTPSPNEREHRRFDPARSMGWRRAPCARILSFDGRQRSSRSGLVVGRMRGFEPGWGAPSPSRWSGAVDTSRFGRRFAGKRGSRTR